MGKPYEIELQNLKQTYEWALKVPIEKLCYFINASHDLPLVAVGSGGSLTAACMAALLHLGRNYIRIQNKILTQLIVAPGLLFGNHPPNHKLFEIG